MDLKGKNGSVSGSGRSVPFTRRGGAGRKNFTFLSALQCEGKSAAARSDAANVVLVPFKTLLAYPFDLPFGKRGNLRGALMLKFRPLIGSGWDMLSMAPQVTAQTDDSTRGTAWLAAKSEITEWEDKLGGGAVFWPPQVAFASPQGSEIIVYEDCDGASAACFKDGEAKFYRWAGKDESTSEELAEWADEYAKALELDADSVRVIRSGDLTEREIQAAGEKALAAFDGLDRFDLSNSGTDMAEQLEAFVAASFKTLKALFVLGITFAALSGGLLAVNLSVRDKFRSAPSDAYAAVFKEQSRSPLSSVKKKLKLLSDDGAQMTLSQTLVNFTEAWAALGAEAGIKIDSIRYGTERTEIAGLAGSMDQIQSLRDALNKNGFNAKADDVQQVPGSELRFSMSLAGAKK